MVDFLLNRRSDFDLLSRFEVFTVKSYSFVDSDSLFKTTSAGGILRKLSSTTVVGATVAMAGAAFLALLVILTALNSTTDFAGIFLADGARLRRGVVLTAGLL